MVWDDIVSMVSGQYRNAVFLFPSHFILAERTGKTRLEHIDSSYLCTTLLPCTGNSFRARHINEIIGVGILSLYGFQK
jgi:hypothetical protein